VKAQLIQLAELADQLDAAGYKTEANQIDEFVKEAMKAEVESGMDMLLTELLHKMLDKVSPEQVVQKIKDKISELTNTPTAPTAPTAPIDTHEEIEQMKRDR